LGLKNARLWQNRLQSSIGLVGIDRKYLWIFINPKTDFANYPVIRLALPETVNLLHNFWELVPEKEGKTIGEKIEAGQSPIGKPCLVCGGAMWLEEGNYGPFLRCTKCRNSKSLTKNDITDFARLNGIMCPNCSSQMAGRKSDLGLFLGCVNYPKCNGIRYIEEFL
jgi:DNA-directed RNA polymerase subunit RPC12/RpoP